jgi:nondiscriminating glutamyl-tRNA synthetase
MTSDEITNGSATAQEGSEPAANPFCGSDIEEILRDRGWAAGALSPEQHSWCEKAAVMLGPHSSDRQVLTGLLSLVFHYHAAYIMKQSETHVVMSRYAAREVLRRLAWHVLEKSPFDSERFKEVVTVLKEELEIRGRELFHPLRLALAGRAGEGELDRVILLVDAAAAAAFPARVKTVRERALEFCAAFD